MYGDYWIDNMILDIDDLCYVCVVVDWEFFILGDLLFDVVLMCVYCDFVLDLIVYV